MESDKKFDPEKAARIVAIILFILITLILAGSYGYTRYQAKKEADQNALKHMYYVQNKAFGMDYPDDYYLGYHQLDRKSLLIAAAMENMSIPFIFNIMKKDIIPVLTDEGYDDCKYFLA